MRIVKIMPQPNRVLSIVAEDGRIGNFDVSPYLELEAFEALKDHTEFLKIFNGGYFVESVVNRDFDLSRVFGKTDAVIDVCQR